MIQLLAKRRTGRPFIGLGLTNTEVAQLEAGDHIVFNLKGIYPELKQSVDILIIYADDPNRMVPPIVKEFDLKFPGEIKQEGNQRVVR